MEIKSHFSILGTGDNQTILDCVRQIVCCVSEKSSYCRMNNTTVVVVCHTRTLHPNQRHAVSLELFSRGKPNRKKALTSQKKIFRQASSSQFASRLNFRGIGINLWHQWLTWLAVCLRVCVECSRIHWKRQLAKLCLDGWCVRDGHHVGKG